MQEPRERDQPRISVNKLGEYMIASPRRRRRLIIDQKRPKEFIVTRYTEAQNAIAEYLSRGAQDDRIICQAIDRLNSAFPTSEWEEEKNQLCAEALESFLEIVDGIDLRGADVLRGNPDPLQLRVAEVAISVRPEVVLRGINRSGAGTVGAVKLYFSKNNPLTRNAALYVGTVVYQHVNEFLSSDNTHPDYQQCLVIDVFDREVYSAPRSFRQRLLDIEAACEEIARAWPLL